MFQRAKDKSDHDIAASLREKEDWSANARKLYVDGAAWGDDLDEGQTFLSLSVKNLGTRRICF